MKLKIGFKIKETMYQIRCNVYTAIIHEKGSFQTATSPPKFMGLRLYSKLIQQKALNASTIKNTIKIKIIHK